MSTVILHKLTSNISIEFLHNISKKEDVSVVVCIYILVVSLFDTKI